MAESPSGGGISTSDFNALAFPIMAAVLREPKNGRIAKFKEELRKVDPAVQPAFEAFGLFVLELGRLPGEEQPAAKPVEETPTKMKRPWSRTQKVVFAIVVVVGLTFVATRFMPDIWRLSHRDRGGQVPVSHFVKESGTNKKVIVFVHGVIGDMDSTWVNPATHASWPELIKGDPELRDFDVFVYGYSSPAFGTASDISEIADRLRQQLKDWNFFTKYDEINFITHSMGGIITKRMLNTLNTPAEAANLRRVRCVIYIAVPSNGAKSADWASWLSRNSQFRSMSPKDAADFLQGTERDWAALLRERNDSFSFPRTYSAYETLSTAEFQVVPQLYTSELSDGGVIGFDYNHIDIVKPKDRNGDVYVWARARLAEASQYQSHSKTVRDTYLLAGAWSGVLEAMHLTMVLHLSGSDSHLSGTIDSPCQNSYGIPITSINRSGKSLTFRVTYLGGNPPLDFVGKVGQSKIEGEVHQGLNTVALTLKPGSLGCQH